MDFRWLVLFLALRYATAQNATDLSNNSTIAASEVTTVSPVVISSTTTTTTRRPGIQGLRLPCSCVEGQCGCCTGAILDRFRQKICANFTYEPDDFAITAQMTMNGRVVYRNTVSGKNPPPMCVSVPRLPFIRFCIQLSNIYFASRNVHVCLDMEANWEEITLIEWSFDCIRMGASGFAVVGPEDGGGLPPSPVDEEEQTDEDYDDSARHAPIISGNDQEIVFDASLGSLLGTKPDRKWVDVRKSNGGYTLLFRNHHQLA